MKISTGFALRLVFSTLVSLSSFVFAQTTPGVHHAASVAWRHPAAIPAFESASIRDCKSCHKAEVVEFLKTPHARLRAPNGKPLMSCETCHGPGRAHARAERAAHGDDAKTAAANRLIFGFHASPRENAEHCLYCHASGPRQAGFEHSTHLLNGVDCSGCHTSHLTDDIVPIHAAPQPALAMLYEVPQRPEELTWLRDGMLKQPEPVLCYTCHGDVRAQFALPVHHRVPEGLLSCSSCHNPHSRVPHGLFNARIGQAGCLKCHPGKRGPFVYEHPASFVTGCLACHTPHGSVNRLLLKRRDTRTLCLECHLAPHADNVPHGRLGFQTRGDCVRCHVAVHGSNTDPYLLK